MAEEAFYYHAAPITIDAPILLAVLEDKFAADLAFEKKTVVADPATHYPQTKLIEDLDGLKKELKKSR